jgi:hypothetical protein
MPNVPPTQSRLIIPGKQDPQAHPRYPDDMRAIEIWANARTLIAGTGITITNPNGPQSTISASGGGGTSFGQFRLIAQNDDNQWSTGFFFPFVNAEFSTEGASFYYVPSTTASGYRVMLGSSWMTDAGAGDSVNIFPTLTVPAFTGGGTVNFQFWFWAASATFSNYVTYNAGAGVNLASGATHQYTAAEVGAALVSGGADLALTAGAGNTGVGITSTAGGIPYWAGVSGALLIPAGVTFT